MYTRLAPQTAFADTTKPFIDPADALRWSNCDDETSRRESVPIALPQQRLAAHIADRGVDADDVRLRPAPGSGHFRLSDFCDCRTAGDHRRRDGHFRQSDRARAVVGCLHCEFRRLFLPAVLSLAL